MTGIFGHTNTCESTESFFPSLIQSDVFGVQKLENSIIPSKRMPTWRWVMTLFLTDVIRCFSSSSGNKTRRSTECCVDICSCYIRVWCTRSGSSTTFSPSFFYLYSLQLWWGVDGWCRVQSWSEDRNPEMVMHIKFNAFIYSWYSTKQVHVPVVDQYTYIITLFIFILFLSSVRWGGRPNMEALKPTCQERGDFTIELDASCR